MKDFFFFLSSIIVRLGVQNPIWHFGLGTMYTSYRMLKCVMRTRFGFLSSSQRFFGS